MFAQLLAAHFIHVALAAGTTVAVLAGLLGPLVVARNNAFAVHGIAELGLTGAAGGLLIGLDATTGALLGSVTVGLLLSGLGLHGRERDTATGTLLAAGLGLGVLFLSRLHAYASTGFGLLFGSITAISDAQLHRLLVISGLVVAVLAVGVAAAVVRLGRPAHRRGPGGCPPGVGHRLPRSARRRRRRDHPGHRSPAHPHPPRHPPAAAQRLTTRPGTAVAVSVAIAASATDGGILASLAFNAPTSFFISVYAFAGYAGARLIGRHSPARRTANRHAQSTAEASVGTATAHDGP